ncbi:MAG: Rieske 2Fe-2S domain-containing protein [Candidatus Woesearchaeota archaeon]|nr:MAG: Rieske 2Fe-2S domain-containing protein [Candidatus Woesearchaeota archaeon]
MKKLNPIMSFLIISILFIISLFSFSTVRQNSFYILAALLVIFSFLFWKKKKLFDFHLTFILLIIYIAARLLFNSLDQPTLILRTSAIISFLMLNLVLLIGPWSRFSKKLISTYQYRRHLGVATFFLSLLHFSIIFPSYFGYSFRNTFESVFTFYGFTALFIMFFLAITSWDYIQWTFKQRWWNRIYITVFLIYLAIAYYAYSIIFKLNNDLTIHLSVFSLFILIWIIAAPFGIIKKIMHTKVSGWKQLHVLIWVAYFSLVMHLSFGVLPTQGIYTKIFFGVMISFVLGSHLVGWVKKILEDRKINKKLNSINKQITEDGQNYVGVADINEFEEGVGKKFYINKKPIAVFKFKDNFIASSNVCAHQKGPLYQGRIEANYIECPWHFCTYNPKEPCDPPFEGCVPFYLTKVVDNILYIGTEPKKN